MGNSSSKSQGAPRKLVPVRVLVERTGEAFEESVDLEVPVLSLQQRLAPKVGVPLELASEILLMFSEEIVGPEGTLASYGLCEDGMLQLVDLEMLLAQARPMLLLGGRSTTERLSTTEVLLRGQWRRSSSLGRKCSLPVAMVWEGRLYVMGGVDGVSVLNTAQVYDPATGRWRELPQFQTARACAGALVGDKLYLVGGYKGITDITPLDSVEVFDAFSESWSEGPALLGPRARGAVAVLEGQIYHIGGSCETGDIVNEVQRLGSSGVWEQVAPLQCARSYASSAVVRGHLIVAGGANGSCSLDNVELYQPASDCWVSIAPMSVPRSASGCLSYRGEMHMLGGQALGTKMSSVEVLDCSAKQPAEWRWRAGPRLNQARSHAICVSYEPLEDAGGQSPSAEPLQQHQAHGDTVQP